MVFIRSLFTLGSMPPKYDESAQRTVSNGFPVVRDTTCWADGPKALLRHDIGGWAFSYIPSQKICSSMVTCCYRMPVINKCFGEQHRRQETKIKFEVKRKLYCGQHPSTTRFQSPTQSATTRVINARLPASSSLHILDTHG